MNIAHHHSRRRISRFERQARIVGIVVAMLLLGMTAIEMASMSQRGRTVQKPASLPSLEGQR
jgi:hypothetical protein